MNTYSPKNQSLEACTTLQTPNKALLLRYQSSLASYSLRELDTILFRGFCSAGVVTDGVGGALSSPVLSLHRKDLVLRPGDDVTLSCVGAAPLIWYIPIMQVSPPFCSLSLSLSLSSLCPSSFLS